MEMTGESGSGRTRSSWNVVFEAGPICGGGELTSMTWMGAEGVPRMATGYPELPGECPQGGHCGGGGWTSTAATVTTTRSGQGGVTSRCGLTGPWTARRAGESHISSTELTHGRLDGRLGVVTVLPQEGSGAGGSAADRRGEKRLLVLWGWHPH